MERSNIFVYIELSKFVDGLTSNVMQAKQNLRSQASYFQIITPKYFSDALYPEWEFITGNLKQKGPVLDNLGKPVANAFTNTIDQMSENECVEIVERIIGLHEKVKAEFQ